MCIISEAQGVEVDVLGQNNKPANSAPLRDEEIEEHRHRVPRGTSPHKGSRRQLNEEAGLNIIGVSQQRI